MKLRVEKSKRFPNRWVILKVTPPMEPNSILGFYESEAVADDTAQAIVDMANGVA